MDKLISVATLITNGTEVLLGKVTGSDNYDFPKGLIDPGESPVQTALREVYEETGLKLDINKLSESLGTFKYLPNKDLNVFVYLMDLNEIDIKQLHCISTFFTNKRGIELPEINGYKIVPFEHLEKYVNKSLYTCFKDFIEPRFNDFICNLTK